MDGIGIREFGKLINDKFQIVDLSPVIEKGIPRWPSHPHLVIDKTVTHEHDGFYCQSISMAEHTGAHVDPPVIDELTEAARLSGKMKWHCCVLGGIASGVRIKMPYGMRKMSLDLTDQQQSCFIIEKFVP